VRRPIHDFDPRAAAVSPTESVIVQGVIDLVIDQGEAATVIDYKTDRARDSQTVARLVEAYRFQIRQYGRALKTIWRLSDVRCALVFLDARRIVEIDA
jgi:ATP-dependent exoDNAse (exonuclease V) beta subunit